MTFIASGTTANSRSATQTNNPVQSLLQNGSSDSAIPDDVEKEPANAAANVTISAEAYERLENDRAVAERLSQLLSPDTGGEAKAATFDEITGAEDKKELTLDDLAIVHHESDANKPLKAVAPDPASMRKAVEDLMVHSVEHRDPEAAQNLREAIADGTVRIRKTEDVPGVNRQSIVTHDGNGGTTVKAGNFNPSPEIQAEIDSGHATTMWSKDHGDLYITW